MNMKWKKIFDKLVVQQYHWSNDRGYNDSGISLETYRELCERKDKISQSFGGTGRSESESQESYRERSEKRIALSDAFSKELKEKNICMDWVNAPMDIISDQQFEIMYASTWEGRNV